MAREHFAITVPAPTAHVCFCGHRDRARPCSGAVRSRAGIDVHKLGILLSEEHGQGHIISIVRMISWMLRVRTKLEELFPKQTKVWEFADWEKHCEAINKKWSNLTRNGQRETPRFYLPGFIEPDMSFVCRS